MSFLSRRWGALSITLIVLIGFFVRVVDLGNLLKSPTNSTLSLASLTNPVADWHSWRQADTISVTREMLKGESTWLIPEYHDLSNIPSGEDNLEGYRMVEFPVYNLLSAWVTPVVGNNVVIASRLVSIIGSLVTIVALYFLVFRLSKDKVAAVASSAFFALLPYSIFYSRTALPETLSVTFSVLSILGFSFWISTAKQTKSALAWFALSLVSCTLALLVKPTIIFIAPVFVALAFAKFGLRAFTQPLLWLYPLTVIPLIIWRGLSLGGTETDPLLHIPGWIEQFPSGIPANKWLLNGNGIRLKPAWWRWLFADRIARLILGYWGVVVVALGAITTAAKKHRQFDVLTFSWVAGMLLYLVVFATGNVQHDYYQIQLIPMLSILAGRGYSWLLTKTKQTNIWLKYGLAAGATGLMMLLGWYQVSGYFNINNPAIVEAGQAVDQKTPQDAVIIAPYQGDTAFLFQTNRRGWPIGFDIQDKIEKGATHYVTTAYDDEARELEAQYATIEKTDLYLLLDLTQPSASVEAELTR
jgi:hypothetical protein